MEIPRGLEKMAPAEGGAPPCACFNVRRMSRAITQIYDDILRPLGLRSTQMSLMTGIAFLGENGIGAISEMMDMDRTTLSRNLKPLLKLGLVEEHPTADGRVRALVLTAKGKSIMEKALPLWEEAQKRIREGLSKEHYAALPSIADEIVMLAQGK